MNRAVVIFAFFILFKPVLPIIEYVLLYDYIRTELCENKEKVELECNGKCHLSKELAQAGESTDGKSEKVQVFTEYAIFYNPLKTELPKPDFNAQTRVLPLVYQNNYSHLREQAVFHPPLA